MSPLAAVMPIRPALPWVAKPLAAVAVKPATDVTEPAPNSSAGAPLLSPAASSDKRAAGRSMWPCCSKRVADSVTAAPWPTRSPNVRLPASAASVSVPAAASVALAPLVAVSLAALSFRSCAALMSVLPFNAMSPAERSATLPKPKVSAPGPRVMPPVWPWRSGGSACSCRLPLPSAASALSAPRPLLLRSTMSCAAMSTTALPPSALPTPALPTPRSSGASSTSALVTTVGVLSPLRPAQAWLPAKSIRS